ncbi:MAG: tetratricopeptide repeat protein [Bacteroidetes bacterium]|nr:MAG: tetratricopeptide repeat protein [Bacteroidota bacterium]
MRGFIYIKLAQSFAPNLPKACLFWGVFLLCCLEGYAQHDASQIATLKATYYKTTVDADKLPILHILAETYLDINTDSAKFYATEAYKLREKARNNLDKTRSFWLMGLALMRTDTPPKEVRTYFEKALEIAEKQHDNVVLGEVYMRFGVFCAYRGHVEEAIKFQHRAIEYYQHTPDVHGLQTSYHNLATAYTQQGKHEKALENFKKALEIFRSQKRDDDTGILSDMGNVYFNQGNFIEALTYYRQGLATAMRLQNLHAQGFCLNNIGLVHNSLGNHDEALEYHLKALKIREKAKTEEGVSNSYNNIGRTYVLLGYNERGRLYIQKSLEIDKKLGKKLAVAQDIDYIATALLHEKKYGEALKGFLEALEIRQGMGQALPVGISLNNIGQVYAQQNKFQEAVAYFLKADSLFAKVNALDFLTNTQIYLAKTYFELKEFAKSEEIALKALASAQQRKTKQEIMEASHILAKVYAQQQKHQEAYQYQTQALAYKDSLNNEERNKRVLRMQAFFEFNQQEKEKEQLKEDKNDMMRLQYITVGIFTLLVVVLGTFVYFLWTNKRRNDIKNKQLAEQNKEITRQAVEIANQKTAIELQNNELQTAHGKLSEANQELLDSIAYAHRIQKAVLPTHEEMLLSLPTHFILYKPRNVVSGDFYWFSDKEKHSVMAVMDCTGHGIPGAFMSLIGNDILHEIVNLREILDPAQILTALKIRINAVLKQHTTKGRDGMDIGICVIDHVPENPDTPRYLHFEAAHLSLLYFQDRILKELEGSKIYIGGYDPDDTERFFSTKKLLLDRTTVCYLFSDGFQDQFAENSKKKFTKKRLRNMLLDLHLLPTHIQGEILDETLEEWKGEGEQTDDIIVFGVTL